MEKSRACGALARGRRTGSTSARSSRDRLGASESCRDRCHRRCSQREASGRKRGCGHSSSHDQGNRGDRRKKRKEAGVSHGTLMKETKMKIGFIGLGIMGSRMAANLQKHGNSLVVFNRTRAKAQPLLGPCGTFSDSPAKLAEQVDLLFTMLAHPDAVEQAALGADGFLNHLRPGALWVDCSSVNPSFSKKMAAEAARREVHFVDAPVTGSALPAAEGKLIFWVGADPADLETIRPLLLCMGNKIVHTGGKGTGTSMKMVVNLLLGTGMAAFAEAMALGEGLGISREGITKPNFRCAGCKRTCISHQ